jgi:hypothetical protein
MAENYEISAIVVRGNVLKEFELVTITGLPEKVKGIIGAELFDELEEMAYNHMKKVVWNSGGETAIVSIEGNVQVYSTGNYKTALRAATCGFQRRGNKRKERKFRRACTCPEHGKPVADRNWVITQYKYTDFVNNAGHFRRPSNRSEILCKECKALWRTPSQYVEILHAQGKIELTQEPRTSQDF